MIQSKIVSVLPRESGGSVASNRFDFQKDWAICKIIELHKNPDDYLITFEHHDDIIIFDSSLNPKKVSFYQIKTKSEKSTHWTFNALLKREQGKLGLLNSYLGKLYDHVLKFGADINSLNFVTNIKVKGILGNGVKCEDTSGFCCADLSVSDLNNIENKLKAEHSTSDLGDFNNIMFFKLGELDINNHSKLTKANLAEFIECTFPGVKYQISPLYKSIFDEVKKKSNIEDAVSDFETLKKRKSISREDFDGYIASVIKSSSMNEVSAAIESRLNSEKANIGFVLSFKRQAKTYEVERMDHTNGILKMIVSICKEVIVGDECSDESLVCLVDKLLVKVKDKLNPKYYVEDMYLRTVLLFELYE